MFEITKDEDYIYVSVSLTKREFAREQKIWIREQDALDAVISEYPEVEIVPIAKEKITASNIREPHSATWSFPLKKTKKPLTDKTKRAKVVDNDKQKTE
jgi:hypothetical protein